MPNAPGIAPSGWGGALGAQTCSIYALDPTGTTAIEPVADLVPGVGPLRVTLDGIDNESYQPSYRVTTNTLQDLTDTTSNVYPELIRLTVTGVFGVAGPMGVGIGVLPSTGLRRLARLDLLRYTNLKRLADQRKPVMVVTPRCSLARCFIVSLPYSWSPSDGDSLPITLSFLEARVMTSSTTAAFADVDSMATGNNKTTGGGTGGVATSQLQGTGGGVGAPPIF
jgi:hypothetical protein